MAGKPANCSDSHFGVSFLANLTQELEMDTFLEIATELRDVEKGIADLDKKGNKIADTYRQEISDNADKIKALSARNDEVRGLLENDEKIKAVRKRQNEIYPKRWQLLKKIAEC